jgi:hypothetical protein
MGKTRGQVTRAQCDAWGDELYEVMGWAFPVDPRQLGRVAHVDVDYLRGRTTLDRIVTPGLVLCRPGDDEREAGLVIAESIAAAMLLQRDIVPSPQAVTWLSNALLMPRWAFEIFHLEELVKHHPWAPERVIRAQWKANSGGD